MVVLGMANQAQERDNQALAGFSSALQDITAELQKAQNQVQHWKLEADAWKCRYEQERCRNECLRRVLRCTSSKDSCALTAQPSLLKTSQPNSPRSGPDSSTQQQQQQQQRLHRHSVPSLPTLDELKEDLRFSSLPVGAEPPKSVTGEGLAPAGHLGSDDGSRDQDGHMGVLTAAAAATVGVRPRTSRSHDGGVRPFQAAADSGSTAAAAGDAVTGQVSRQQHQRQLPDPFATCSSQDLDLDDPGDHLPGGQQQQQQKLEPKAADHEGLSATMSALMSSSPAATAAAADGLDRRVPPPLRRSSTLPRNWEQFTAEVGKSFTAGDINLLRSSGSLMPMPGSSGSSGSSKHTIDQLLRMMMAFTIMQGGGSGNTTDLGVDSTEDEPLQSVSLDDDDGSSGVGLAAAAAVSAAMARAWASAASKEQRAVAAAAASGNGGGGSGESAGGSQRAGFRLVATVTNKMGKRAPSSAALSSAYSQDSLDNAGGSSSSSADLANLGQQQQQQQPSPLSRSAATSDTDNTAAAAGGKPPVPPASPQQGSSSMKQPAAATAAANNSSNSAAPSCGQATAISLHWLSRPRAVLVMRKLAPSVDGAFNKALEWLRRHHITIYVEPKIFQELVDSGRVQQHSSSSSSGLGKAGGSSNSISGMLTDNGNGSSSSSTISGTLIVDQDSSTAAAGGKDGSSSSSNKGLVCTSSWPVASRYASSSSSTSLIKTWQPELLINQEQQQQDSSSSSTTSSSAKESDLIPECVAQQLDLVIILGGDGTVLWTCHIFGNRSVPPLVPFNLGSLGFLTPFDPAKIETVLHKTLRGGFPITLRHRLHATIVRRASTPCPPSSSRFAPSSSSCDCMPAVSRNCLGAAVYGEEHVALNEVVIERGISPFLTNLECFCDGGFVTHVQGDGLIIGTPTGSTAYSLAAGGSMVHPQVPCILFTPICPHSLSFRPLMFPDYCQLCIQVPVDSRGHVWASFDGKDRTELVPGDAVVIRLSKWPVPSVAAEADPSGDWFSAVRECLHWNLRKVQGGAGG